MSHNFLDTLGLAGIQSGASTGGAWLDTTGDLLPVATPVDGSNIGTVKMATRGEYEQVVSATQEAFKTWRHVPAPLRGEVIRKLGEEFRRYKTELGALISLIEHNKAAVT